jgi:hypothetical protein
MIVVVSRDHVVMIVVGHNLGRIVVVVPPAVEPTVVISTPATMMVLRPRMAVVPTSVIPMGISDVDVDAT